MDNARKEKKKVVYIGFGSIVVSDPKAVTRCVVDAIVQSGVYAILSKGWSDRLVKNAASAQDTAEPFPKEIYPIASIPHDWLFKRIDAACHHGGAGTTGASLRGMQAHINWMFTRANPLPSQPEYLPSSNPFSETSSSGPIGSKHWELAPLFANLPCKP